MKNVLKVLLLTIIYFIINSIAYGFMPFSGEFQALSQGTGNSPSDLLLIGVHFLWSCIAVSYLAFHANWNGVKLIIGIIGVMFFIQSFMSQVETLFFGSAFQALTTSDILLMMLAGIFPLLVVTPLAVKFFHKPVTETCPVAVSLPLLLRDLVLIGLIYLVIYMVFGYYVAFQFDEVRHFYGADTNIGFLGQLMENIRSQPAIYPFQIFRGIVFGLSVVPVIFMLKNKIRAFLIEIVLLFVSFGIMLIIPNPLFPDTVRFAHFLEVTSSMLLFSFLTWFILKKHVQLQTQPALREEK